MSAEKGDNMRCPLFSCSLSPRELQGKARRGTLPPLPPKQPNHCASCQHLHLPQ